MFRLERVEISGFKSFYEKVDLAFPGSVTAVVGPNGCGKSNICDAVAWALGEQSAKTLRGERMDDVIFNGSAKRRPLGMAEVILTLSRRPGTPVEPADGGDPADADSAGASSNGNGNGNGGGHEALERETLKIGRRVYREGQGEYFLDDKQVRLKDIQDRLLGTGLGVRAYSVIEQGRIDQVLSTKPQDRRRLIEEAAGITKYKLKKRIAETKLEETRGNLLRLSDILSEIERNVASLKRQASRAARYKEQSEALRAKRAALARTRHDRLLIAVADADRALAERRDAEAESAAALARAEAELATARLAAAEAGSERDRLRDAVSARESAIQRDEALLASNRRAAADLEERSRSLERDGQSFSVERTRAAREVAEIEERLERAVAEARVRSLSREEADRKASAAAAALTSLELELDRARADSLAAAGESVAARNARHEIDVAASRVAAAVAAAEETRGRLLRELAARQAELTRSEEERRRLTAAAAEARREVESWEAELSRLSRSILESEAARESAREALGALEHRRAALLEVLEAREGSTRSLRGALTAAGIVHRAAFSDRLRPARGWEAAVDQVLGEDLSAVITAGDPLRAADVCRELRGATLVREDWNGASDAAPPPAGAHGWKSALANYDELRPAELGALPHVFFVDDLAEALRLSEEQPGATFVTRGRELVRGSLLRLSGPGPEASGIFALRGQTEELESRAVELRATVATLERSLEKLRRERSDRESEMPARRDAERRAEAALSAFLARFEERASEQDRAARELDTLAAEAESSRSSAADLDTRRRALEEEERRHAGRETVTRERADALAAMLPEARSVAMAVAEELAHRRTEAELAAERRRSAESAREKLLEGGAALERRIAEAGEETRRLVLRREELAEEERDARARQAEALESRVLRAEELERASAAFTDATARAEAAEAGARASRSALDACRESRFESEVSRTRVGADLDHLIAQTRAEFGSEPSALEPPPDDSPEALDLLEKEALDLSASIERMGPVNVLAYEEHQQEKERLEFLTVQRDDLLKSIAELQESIRKINATSSERFRNAFLAINENFKATFARLFQGGAAEMRLLDESDLLESGVEIVAQPPGKRNQSILLLSGGEKALTAIALLMAIFRYKPSPFCILDEVDAPLDEANIDRFTRLLREMTEDTQFIAITHNKRTMETADVMYGVTMEEPGCSKIVSVKFD